MYDPLRAKTKAVLLTATAFVFGVGLAGGLGWTSPSHAMPALNERPQVAPEAVRPALDLSDAFTNLADAVTPSVVRIESRRTVTRSSRQQQQVPDAFRRFFDLPEGGNEPQQPPRGAISGGSGFVVSEDGYILTNNHVVEGADEVRVYFPDRRYFDAEVVGNDPFTDVAVIKIDTGEALPHMSLGNSDGIRVGEWILAIGNPGFGASTQLDFTVTAGIVSARGRGLQLLQRDLFSNFGPDAAGWAIEDFIQTDAVINPGNSGGPMVNLHGQVVGINSAIASTTGSYQGYGFAIPINLARRVMEDLVEYGHVRRPRIGVRIDNVVAEDAAVYGLPSVSGVLVQSVEAGGPSSGQLRAQDVIVAIDGEPVGYTAELQAKIAERRPGDRVVVRVYRDRRPVEVTIRLDEAPIVAQTATVATRTAHAEERLGIHVATIDSEVAQATGFEAGSGVVLTEVAPGSAAARRGVDGYRGNRVVRINDREIGTPEDVRESLDRIGSGEIASMVFEDTSGQQRVVNIRMP